MLLNVHVDAVFAASHAFGHDAEALRAELASITREWETVSHGWTGSAASAYDALWQEWRAGAMTVVDALAESSQTLGRAAVAYTSQDTSSAELLDAAPIDLGL